MAAMTSMLTTTTMTSMMSLWQKRSQRRCNYSLNYYNSHKHTTDECHAISLLLLNTTVCGIGPA